MGEECRERGKLLLLLKQKTLEKQNEITKWARVGIKVAPLASGTAPTHSPWPFPLCSLAFLIVIRRV